MISVIIPIYNSSYFLERTFESVLKQTFSNFEVIMVDDGSTDNSSEICKFYANKDKRFKYFFKNNTGVADSRNIGLINAQGNYISFLDSDDTYEEFFLEKLFDAIVNNENIAIAVCNINVINRDGKKVLSDFNQKEENVIISDSEFCLMQNFLGAASLWNKIYKKEILDNIKFPSGMLFEDNYIFHEIFGNSKYSLVILNDYLYNYHYNINSITRRNSSLIRYNDYIKGLIRRWEFFKNKTDFSLATHQTKNIILYEMIQYFLKSKEVKKNSVTRKFLIKNLFFSEIHFKTKVIVFVKMFLSAANS